ncbi:hypothetical protein ACP4OV_027284 [Aristida adscensionis]
MFNGEDPENCSYFPELGDVGCLQKSNWAYFVLEEITLCCLQVVSDQKSQREP